MKPLEIVERARTVVVLLVLAATALIVFRLVYDQYLLPKYVWVAVLTACLAALTAARFALRGDVRVRLHWLNAALLVWLIWKAFSWLWAESRPLAGEEIRWWAGLLLWAVLLQDWVGASKRRILRCAGVLAISALLLSLWILLQDFGVEFFDVWARWIRRWPDGLRISVGEAIERLANPGLVVSRLADWRGFLSAGLGNTNHIADYLAVLFPMIGMLYLSARRRWVLIGLGATLGIVAAALTVCWSVGSNGGLILAAVVMLILLVRNEPPAFWRERAGRIAAIAVVFLFVVAFYVFPHPLNPHRGGIFRQAFGSERWQAGWPTRVAIWLNSAELGKRHPVFGSGTGTFTYGYTLVHSPAVMTDPDLVIYTGEFTNAAHNALLQAWVEEGVAGPLILLVLWVLFFRAAGRNIGRERDEAVRRMRIALVAMMAAFVAHSMMNFTLQLPTSSMIFVSLIAFVAALDRNRDEFPLSVRMEYPVVELDLETTGMRRVESIGLRASGSAGFRVAVAVVAVVAGMVVIAQAMRPLVADTWFRRAKDAVAGAPGSPAQFAQRALAVDDDHYHAWKMMGQYLLAAGQPAEARKAFQKVAPYESVYDFYKEWGWSAMRSGDPTRAGELWAIYFERQPKAIVRDAQFFRQFSDQYPEQADALLSEIPDEFFRALGEAALDFGDPETARGAWEIFLERRPDALDEDPFLREAVEQNSPDLMRR